MTPENQEFSPSLIVLLSREIRRLKNVRFYVFSVANNIVSTFQKFRIATLKEYIFFKGITKANRFQKFEFWPIVSTSFDHDCSLLKLTLHTKLEYLDISYLIIIFLNYKMKQFTMLHETIYIQ